MNSHCPSRDNVLPTPRILFATNSERGQCGVFLATARALLCSNPHTDLHFASFAILQKDVEAISREALCEDPTATPIVFHSINAKTHTEVVTANIVASYGKAASFPTPAMTQSFSITTTMEAIRDICGFLLGWDGPEFMKLYDCLNDIIESVMPDLIIVDVLMTPAVTAAWNSGIPFSYLSPNSIKDAAGKSQSRFDLLFKYPALFSGFRYPVPWRLKPLNAFFVLYLLYRLLREPSLSTTKRFIEEKTGKPMKTLSDRGTDFACFKFFVSSLPEIDFPMSIPPYVVPCGPIIAEGPPIFEVDRQLAVWLSKGPTVYVNLGSLYKMSEERAEELAKALAETLTEVDKLQPDAPQMQVLWKLKKLGDYELAASGCTEYFYRLGDAPNNDRVRIVDWLVAPPISILRAGNIACSVHHGGANSYNEALLVEMLGIGLHGCRNTQPVFHSEELSRQLLRVLIGNGAKEMKMKALKLAAVCEQYGSGPKIAAEGILKLVAK
ncbi:hypothetical protein PWT90_05865 [Aphanocladium album]|nr:hypothetical protein PWT90_05865 [Aphanocladium album]